MYWRPVRLHGDWKHDYRRLGDPACCGMRDARGVASTWPTSLLLRAALWRHASVVGADCSADSDVILLSPDILIMECCGTAQFRRAVKFNAIIAKGSIYRGTVCRVSMPWRLWVISFSSMPFEVQSEAEVLVQTFWSTVQSTEAEVLDSWSPQFSSGTESVWQYYISQSSQEGREKRDILTVNRSVLWVKYCVMLGTFWRPAQFPVSGCRKLKVHSNNSSGFDSIIFAQCDSIPVR